MFSRPNNQSHSSTKIHILQAKLDADTITELYSLIDSSSQLPTPDESGPIVHLELSANPSDADVIVTNIRMRKRFERHLDWDIAVG